MPVPVPGNVLAKSAEKTGLERQLLTKDSASLVFNSSGVTAGQTVVDIAQLII
jgi:hypothetical protein